MLKFRVQGLGSILYELFAPLGPAPGILVHPTIESNPSKLYTVALTPKCQAPTPHMTS